MSTERIEKEFLTISKLTSYFFGNPFEWHEGGFIKKPNKLYQITRCLLNIGALSGQLNCTIWFFYGRSAKDQAPFEDLIDFIYSGGYLIINGLLLTYFFLEDSIAEFLTAILYLNKRFRDEFKITNPKRRKKLQIQKENRMAENWFWWLTLYVQVVSVLYGIASVIIYARSPSHRRNDYNVLLGTIYWGDWKMYLIFLIHFARIMYYWGALLLYVQIGTFYVQTSRFWIKECRFDHPSQYVDQSIRIRFNSAWVIRSIELLNIRYNQIFGFSNFFLSLTIWINLIGYSIGSILYAEPEHMPEYFVFPLVAICMTAYFVILIKSEMFSIVTYFDEYSQGWSLCRSKEFKNFLRSIKKLRVEVAGFYLLSRNSAMIFVVSIMDTVINILIAKE